MFFVLTYGHFLFTMLLLQIFNMGGIIMPKQPIKPGTDNQPAGTYREVGPRGGQVPNGRTVHIDQGDRLPPTQKPGRGWTR